MLEHFTTMVTVIDTEESGKTKPESVELMSELCMLL
jgi:hypothetical protein